MIGAEERVSPPAFRWNDEAIENAKRWWLAGDSAAIIAGRLGGGVTRNSVLGKMHRLKVKQPGVRHQTMVMAGRLGGGGVHRHKPKPEPRIKIVRPPRVEPEIEPFADLLPLRSKVWEPLPGTSPVPLEALGDGCKWPLGDGPFMFCGAPKDGEHPSYCATHRRIGRSGVI